MVTKFEQTILLGLWFQQEVNKEVDVDIYLRCESNPTLTLMPYLWIALFALGIPDHNKSLSLSSFRRLVEKFFRGPADLSLFYQSF